MVIPPHFVLIAIYSQKNCFCRIIQVEVNNILMTLSLL